MIIFVDILLVFLLTVSGETIYCPKNSSSGICSIALSNSSPSRDPCVSCSNVKFYLSTKEVYNYTELFTGDKKTLNQSSFNKTLKTVLVLNGWTAAISNAPVSSLREAFFKDAVYNVNYIVIDWTDISSDYNYLCVLERIQSVAKCVRDFLISLSCKISDITIIGHSLGAQLAAEISRGFFYESGEKVKKIIALDAARPCIVIPNVPYQQEFCENFLTLYVELYKHFEFPAFKPLVSPRKGDANFVIGIHSSCLHGIPQPSNDKDIYLGNGCTQSVCDSDTTAPICDHEIVGTIFTMFISGDNFQLYICKNYQEVLMCQCNEPTNVSMYSMEESEISKIYQVKSYTVDYNGITTTSKCQAIK